MISTNTQQPITNCSRTRGRCPSQSWHKTPLGILLCRPSRSTGSRQRSSLSWVVRVKRRISNLKPSTLKIQHCLSMAAMSSTLAMISRRKDESMSSIGFLASPFKLRRAQQWSASLCKLQCRRTHNSRSH